MDKNNIFNNFLIQLELDFFVSDSLKNVAKNLKTELGKNIIFPKELKTQQGIIVVGEELNPTMNTFVLSSAKMGLQNMKNIKTAFLPAGDMKMLVIKILNWIKNNGYTTKNCNLNMSFTVNTAFAKDLRFTEIDKLRLFLEINEKEIFKNFPTRKGLPTIRSVKYFTPVNKFILSKNMDVVNVNNFRYLLDEFSAIDISNIGKDVIKFKYLGGEDYEKIQPKVSKILDLYTETLFTVCTNPQFTENNLYQLKNILKQNKKVSEAFNSLDMFSYYFPDIIPMVDLKGAPEILKSFWNTIRDRIYDVITNGGMKAGFINFDTDAGKYQIKDAILSNAYNITDFEIFNSKLTGIYRHCDFFDCTLQDAHILESNLLRSNLIKKSEIVDTHIQFNNKLEDCIINNKNSNINGKLDRCIIIRGIPGTLAVLTDCKIIKKV